MLKIVKKYSAVILISATASLCVPSVAQACQLAPCASAHQSSTRISVESGVRVYRGTVHRQDYKTQLKYNAQRERAAKAQALRDKRAAERRASIAEANRLKAEQALTSRPQRRRTRQRFTTFSNSSFFGSGRRAFGVNNVARKPRRRTTTVTRSVTRSKPQVRRARRSSVGSKHH